MRFMVWNMAFLIKFAARREKTFFLLIFVALTGAVFAPVVFGGQTLFSAVPGLALENGPYGFHGLVTPWTLDPGAYMWSEVPQTVFLYRSLRAGIFPFWNPYQAGGQPLSGAILAAAWNPFKLFFFFFFPYLKTFDFYLLFRVVAAGFGTFLFLRKLRLSRRAAFLGGVAYMFSGYFTNWITGWQLGADMMTPYVLLGIELLFERACLKTALVFGVFFAAMVLSASPEAVIAITLFSFLYFFFSRGRKLHGVSRRSAAYAALGLAVAFVACVPMLWDITLFFGQGMQAHGGPRVPWTWTSSFSVTALSRAVQTFLSPAAFLEVARMGGLYRNNGFVMPPLGVFMTLFAVAAVSARRAFPYRSSIIFFGMYAAFFLLKLAEIPPVSWIGALPVFNQVIFIKYAGTLYFSFAILAAFGYQAMYDKAVSVRRFALAVFAILAIFMVFIAYSATFRAAYRLSFAPDALVKIESQLVQLPVSAGVVVRYGINHPYAYAYFLAALAGAYVLLFLVLWKKGSIGLMLLALIIEMVLYIPKLRDGGFSSFDPFQEPPFIAFLKARQDMGQYRIFSFGKVLLPDAASAYGLKDFRTNDPVYLRRFVEYMRPAFGANYLERIRDCWCVTLRAEDISPQALALLRKASVRFVISETSLALPAPYRAVYSNEVFIYEDASALPIAYFARGTENVAALPVAVISYTPNRVALRVSAASAGTLVLNDAYYAGWRATVSGVPTSIFPWNGMFRGVAIPHAGDYEVVFSYSPFNARLRDFTFSFF